MKFIVGQISRYYRGGSFFESRYSSYFLKSLNKGKTGIFKSLFILGVLAIPDLVINGFYCTYLHLLRIVSPRIENQSTAMRAALSPHERLAATLRFLAVRTELK